MGPVARGLLTVAVQTLPIVVWSHDRAGTLGLAAWMAAHLVWLERGAAAMVQAAGGVSRRSATARAVALLPRLGTLVLGLWWIVDYRGLVPLDVVLGMVPGHLLYGTWLILGLGTSESETMTET